MASQEDGDDGVVVDNGVVAVPGDLCGYIGQAGDASGRAIGGGLKVIARATRDGLAVSDQAFASQTGDARRKVGKRSSAGESCEKQDEQSREKRRFGGHGGHGDSGGADRRGVGERGSRTRKTKGRNCGQASVLSQGSVETSSVWGQRCRKREMALSGATS